MIRRYHYNDSDDFASSQNGYRSNFFDSGQHFLSNRSFGRLCISDFDVLYMAYKQLHILL